MGTPGAADKNQIWALLQEHVSQADGRQTLSKHAGSGKAWTVFQTACWRLLQSGPSEYWPLEWGPTVWSHENGQNPFRKVWLQIKEDLGWKVTGSKLGASKDTSLWNLR